MNLPRTESAERTHVDAKEMTKCCDSHETVTSFGCGLHVLLVVQWLITCQEGRNATKGQCIVSLMLEIFKRQDTWPDNCRQDKLLSSMSWCVVGAHRFFRNRNVADLG